MGNYALRVMAFSLCVMAKKTGLLDGRPGNKYYRGLSGIFADVRSELFFKERGATACDHQTEDEKTGQH